MTAKQCVIGILVALVAAGAFTVRAADVDYAKAVADAQQAGDTAGVSRLCSKWAAAEPGDERPRIILGRTLLEAGMMDRAVEQFELAAEANPLSPAPRCELGLLFLRASKPDPAAKEFGESLRIDAAYLPARVGLARAKLALGDAESALADARQVQQAAEGNPKAKILAVDCLLALGRTDEALAEVGEGGETAPVDADLRYTRAFILELTDRGDEAQQAWQKFLEAEPEGERAERVRNGCIVLETRVLPRPAFYGSCSAVSPDGRQVAYVVGNRGIDRAPLDGSDKPVSIVSAPQGWAQRWLAWSGDGRGLVCHEYATPSGKGHRIKWISCDPSNDVRILDFPGQKRPGVPAVSPSGTEVLMNDYGPAKVCLLSPANGEHRWLDLVDPAGQRLYVAGFAYMPSGKELVGVAAPAKDKLGLYRIAMDTGKAATELLELGKRKFRCPVVSEDGTAVAGMVADRPCYLAVASTSLPAHLTQLREAKRGTRPSWHPEGRQLVSCVVVSREQRLAILRLGGIDRRPVQIQVSRKRDEISLVVTSRTQESQQLCMRWEAFDAGSIRIGAPGGSEESAELKPGEKVEWTIEIPAENKAKVRTLKVRVLNQDGVGAVKLIDWTEEGQ